MLRIYFVNSLLYIFKGLKAFSLNDILNGIKVLLNNQITMSEITEKFQYGFAKYVGAKYALMVNSGSSANLLAAFALVNPRKKNLLTLDKL